MAPRILASRDLLNKATRAPILLSFKSEKDADRLRKGRAYFRNEFCIVKNYVETSRISRCHQCHELNHSTQKCTKQARCVFCGSMEHPSTSHPRCNTCTDTTNCTHNGLKCINCAGPHASNYSQCPAWLKKRGVLRESNPTTSQPVGGRAKKAPRGGKAPETPALPQNKETTEGSTKPPNAKKGKGKENNPLDLAKEIPPHQGRSRRIKFTFGNANPNAQNADAMDATATI
jgi:hypothetical protein